jgi:hypothetical protein
MLSPAAFSYLTSTSSSLATVRTSRHCAGALETSPCTRAYEEGLLVAEAYAL